MRWVVAITSVWQMAVARLGGGGPPIPLERMDSYNSENFPAIPLAIWSIYSIMEHVTEQIAERFETK